MKNAIFFLAVMAITPATLNAESANDPNELLINKDIRFFNGVPKVLLGTRLFSWETKQKNITEIWAKDRTYALATRAEKEQLAEFTEMGYDFSDDAEFAPVISQNYEITNGVIKSGTLCRMDVNPNAAVASQGPVMPKQKKPDSKIMECWTINDDVCVELNQRDQFLSSLTNEDSEDDTNSANQIIEVCKGLMGVLKKLYTGTLDQINGPQTVAAQKSAILSTQQLYQRKMSEGLASFKMKEQQPLNVKSLSEANHILDYYSMAKVACGKMKMYKNGSFFRTKSGRETIIKDIQKPQNKSPVTS